MRLGANWYICSSQKKWRGVDLWRGEPHPIFHAFLEEYDQVLNSRMIPCSQAHTGAYYCEGIIRGTYKHPAWITSRLNDDYGIPSLTCYQCMRSFCISCGHTQRSIHTSHLVLCSYCEKYFCAECLVVRLCASDTCCAPKPTITSCTGCDRFNKCNQKHCFLQFCDYCVHDNLNQCQQGHFTCQYCASPRAPHAVTT